VVDHWAEVLRFQASTAKVVDYPRCCVFRQSITKDVLILPRRFEATHVFYPNRFSNAFPLGGNLVHATPLGQFYARDVQVDNDCAIEAGARRSAPTVA
jgi:hypothetical protein